MPFQWTSCWLLGYKKVLLLLACLVVFLQLQSAATMALSMQRLAGQRVLVTGAGRGIGQAIARICHSEGAKVAIAARTRSQLEETVALLEPHRREALTCAAAADEDSNNETTRVSMHVADVTIQSDVDRMVQDVVKAWGGIDILINNAGRGQAAKGSLQDMDAEDLVQLLNLNVVAVQRVTRAVLQQAEPKQIIQISSKAGKVGLPNMSFYCASKFALEGMTAALAVELKDKVRVNSISPGMVDTESFPKPAGRPGVRTPDSIADGLFVLLQSDVTGHYLHVDELDEARRRGLDDSIALKPINEADFVSSLPVEQSGR